MSDVSVESELLGPEPQVLSKEGIRQRLHLYHGTTPKNWERMQEAGAILSQAELVKRGLLSPADLTDLASGEVDRAIGDDNFVFLSLLMTKVLAT